MNAGQETPDRAHRYLSMQERDGDEFAHWFDNAEDAIAHARMVWDSLTPAEKGRSEVYAGKARITATDDEGNGCDWETVHILWEPGTIEEVQNIAEATVTTTVARQGNSLVVTITEQARLLGIERGDAVEVTIRRTRK